jgi:hypothetical protein
MYLADSSVDEYRHHVSPNTIKMLGKETAEAFTRHHTNPSAGISAIFGWAESH